MAEKKTGAAKHSADYRSRQREEAERLGIETMSVDVPSGFRKKMAEAAKRHGYKQLQEVWQNLALSWIAADPEEQARRLKRPDASAFKVTPKLARKFDKFTKAELKRNPGVDIIPPEKFPLSGQ